MVDYAVSLENMRMKTGLRLVSTVSGRVNVFSFGTVPVPPTSLVSCPDIFSVNRVPELDQIGILSQGLRIAPPEAPVNGKQR